MLRAAPFFGLVAGLLFSALASAIPPFPITDQTNGTPGAVDPNWSSILTNNTVGNKFTSDQWLRLNDAGNNEVTDIFNATAFPATTGFQVQFDYRQAGGTPFGGSGPTGDGISFFLFDGTATVTAGAPGSGLAYGRDVIGNCGVTGAYLGLGLDVFGNFAVGDKGNYSGVGGVGSATQLPNAIDLRGSGPGVCAPSTTTTNNTQYPWVTGQALTAAQGTIWTGVAGDFSDPATEPNSLRRRYRQP